MARHVISRRWAYSQEPHSRPSLEDSDHRCSMPTISMDVMDGQDSKDLLEDTDSLAMEVTVAMVEAVDHLAETPTAA